MLRDSLQELKELGLHGTLFRIGWELRSRSGLAGRFHAPPRLPHAPSAAWIGRLPFADPVAVARAMEDRIPVADREALRQRALEGAHGRIRAFGRHEWSYGDPIDWSLDPSSGLRRDPRVWWTHALEQGEGIGDVKLAWEVARFPHAWELARAAAFFPELTDQLSTALTSQIHGFLAANQPGRGVHWASGQEVAFRHVSWLFALDTLLSRSSTGPDCSATIADALVVGTAHIAEHIDYARRAVYNNHLLSEALGLYAAGTLLGDSPVPHGWREFGRELLVEGAGQQFYEDGAYIQQSHNYHRVALHILLWACSFARAAGDRPAPEWLRALDRSLDFLVAHQNPADGRLPNYGANDGAGPAVLSTCNYSDFRPALQAVAVLTRGERIYPPGPWDETAAWLWGPAALDAPLRPPRSISRSFGRTGYHVLRGTDQGTFATFRCGTIRDRFSQIDMLHVDLFFRGENVLVDGGSYLYNGPSEWHEHFYRTGSHNTVSVDGLDQMAHYRKFKNLYWTRAQLEKFEDGAAAAVATGTHEGYTRLPRPVRHRRSVALVKDDLLIVVDGLLGEGSHDLRLHWLCGQFPVEAAGAGRLSLQLPGEPLSLAVYDETALPLPLDVVAGQERPIRGWLSRYYAERLPVPSVAVTRTGPLPFGFVTVVGTGSPRLVRTPDGYAVMQGERRVHFAVTDGAIIRVEIEG